MIEKFLKLSFVILFTSLLFGCALTPKDNKANAQSNSLLTKQLETIEDHLKKSNPNERTVVYIGSAQHSQSLVFERDILLVKSKILKTNPNAKSILLSNQLESSHLNYPFATLENLDRIFKKVGEWSKNHPINLIALISTHGNVDVLSVNIANSYWPAVRSFHMKKWLDGLNNVPTAILLSACYSGSFIQPLVGDNRVVLTAAAHNRNSFGCAYHGQNTYFIGNLFGNDWNAEDTWQKNYLQMYEKIKSAETKLGLPNSNPQIYLSNGLKNQQVSDLIKGISQNKYLTANQ